jgi:hypothetical protein
MAAALAVAALDGPVAELNALASESDVNALTEVVCALFSSPRSRGLSGSRARRDVPPCTMLRSGLPVRRRWPS